jgi:hypothetical protein
MTAGAIMASSALGTPETYLDSQRSQGFTPALQAGVHSYPGVSGVSVNQFALKGTWNVGSESATPYSAGATIEGGIQAAHVYLVMTSSGNVPRTGRVLIGGRPVPPREAGSDVHGGTFTVRGQRLYSLVSLPSDAQFDLTVQIPPGVRAYDFTFG